MNEILLEFSDTFASDRISQKRICNRPTLISVDANRISITFDSEIQISKSYIDQTSAFLRNYSVVTGQIFRLDKSNLDIQDFYPLLNQSLLFSAAKDKPRNIRKNMDDFFGSYRSKEPYYEYINNSVPWLIILSQTDFFIQKIRLLFTLLEMLVVKYHPSRKIGNRYYDFFETISITTKSESEFVDSMIALWNNENVRNTKEGFTGIARMANGIINVHKGTNRELIASFAYELRNRNFHGNMSPVIYMSTSTSALLSKLYDITLSGIYEYLEKVIKEVV